MMTINTPAEETQDFLKTNKIKVLQWPHQLTDLNTTERAFQVLKTKPKANEQAATEDGCSRDLTNHLQGGDSV